MRFRLAIAAIVLGAVTVPALAEPDITAYAPARHARSISGPDAVGRYTLRVSISDLDPASPAGWRVMDRRVAMGTSLLCDAAGAEPVHAGLYDPVRRACRSEIHDAAMAQMIVARDMARKGNRVAVLDLSR